MEINKLRKVLTSFERNHGKLYESVDVEVTGEDITYNAKAATTVDGAKLNVVQDDTIAPDCEPAHFTDGVILTCNQKTLNMLQNPIAPAI